MTDKALAYVEGYAKKNDISLSLSAQIFIAKGLDKYKKEEILSEIKPVAVQQGDLPLKVVPINKKPVTEFFGNRMIGWSHCYLGCWVAFWQPK